MAKGEGNPIDPSWWNLGNLNGNLDDLVDSDLNLILRPEGEIPQSTSGWVTEEYIFTAKPNLGQRGTKKRQFAVATFTPPSIHPPRSLLRPSQ